MLQAICEAQCVSFTKIDMTFSERMCGLWRMRIECLLKAAGFGVFFIKYLVKCSDCGSVYSILSFLTLVQCFADILRIVFNLTVCRSSEREGRYVGQFRHTFGTPHSVVSCDWRRIYLVLMELSVRLDQVAPSQEVNG